MAASPWIPCVMRVCHAVRWIPHRLLGAMKPGTPTGNRVSGVGAECPEIRTLVSRILDTPSLIVDRWDRGADLSRAIVERKVTIVERCATVEEWWHGIVECANRNVAPMHAPGEGDEPIGDPVQTGEGPVQAIVKTVQTIQEPLRRIADPVQTGEGPVKAIVKTVQTIQERSRRIADSVRTSQGPMQAIVKTLQ